MDQSLLINKTSILEQDYSPTYTQLFIHPEEGETFEINSKFNDIKYDINNINDIIIASTNNIESLMNSTINRLEAINKNIINEKERLQDIKMLCNKYTDFDKVLIINDWYGTAFNNDGTLSNKVKSFNNVSLSLNMISGNGYVGNKYVYKNYSYVKDILDTSDENALFDDSISTYWEYQRITANSEEKYLLNDFYMDSEEARCTLTLESKEDINELIVSTDIESLKITNIQYSNNNIDYYSINIPAITFSKLDCYSNNDYIYGSGILTVPNCKYLKITFQSNGSSNDTIAYERVMFEDDTFNEKSINDTETITTEIKSAKRHLIKINDIKAYKKQYHYESYCMTSELIDDSKYYSVSVFANTYIPTELNDNSIEFILTINGKDYTVIPINDNTKYGTKIIRYSQGNSKSEYTELTNEVITSVYLTIKFKGTKDITPYVNNVKILLGGEI